MKNVPVTAPDSTPASASSITPEAETLTNRSDTGADAIPDELKARIDRIIDLYNLHIEGDKVGTRTRIAELSKNTQDFAFIRENKPLFMTRIPALQSEKEEKRKQDQVATVTFYTGNWESHEASIDTQKDLSDQFARIAAMYPDDCTPESVQKDYERHLENKESDTAEKNKKKTEKEAVRAAAFALAKETGKNQLICRWTEDCDDPREECNLDSVSEYAMPDGTAERIRQHTW